MASESQSEPGSGMDIEREAKNPVGSQGGKPPRRRFIDKFTPVVTRADGLADKKGTIGNKLDLTTNYVRVVVEHQNQAGLTYQYRIDFDPLPTPDQQSVQSSGTGSDLEEKKVAEILAQRASVTQNFKVIRQWAEDKNVPGFAYIYDGRNVLYVGQSVGERLEEKFRDNVQLKPTQDNAAAGQLIAVIGTRAATVANDDPQMMVLMNTQLKRFQENEMNLLRVRDSCFDPRNAKKPQGSFRVNIEIWSGFETAIGVFEYQQLMLCIDPRFRIVRLEKASAFIAANLKPIGRLNPQQAVTEALTRQVVETPVETVDWTKSPASTFTNRKGVTQSFADYYRQRHRLIVTNMAPPLLVVKPSNKELRRDPNALVYLIPELCQMTGYTDQMRSDFRLMQAVAAHTKLAPAARKQNVLSFVQKINTNEKVKLQLDSWGIKYGNELVKLQGRQLGAQKLSQGANEFSYPVEGPADWTKSLRTRLETPKEMKRWLVLYGGGATQKIAHDFVEAMKQVAGPMGVVFGQQMKMVDAGSDRPDAYFKVLQSLYCSDLAFVLIVVPNNNKERYDALKQQLCIILPCPSQVIMTKTMERNVRSVATKVVLQINAKLGGDIWKMKFPFSNPVMVVGIQTHRDPKRSRTVVVGSGSYNSKLSLYYSAVEFAPQSESFQAREKELNAVIACIVNVVRGCLDYFKTINRCAPMQIFIYRDGISEGQLLNVKEKELVAINDMLVGYSTIARMKCTYILVNKRESTRFFVDKGGTQQNPPSGTVVDDVVTRPWRYDFYLVSQSVREGTVAPTYYDVIQNETDLKPTHMQLMTYMLCHMYFNWPGTIRVPAPCQYAGKYAQLVAGSLHDKASPVLDGKLFFL